MLPGTGKTFERTLCTNMNGFFTENKLISPYQLGFKPDYSRINQFLTIAHEIYKSFDDVLECRGIFFCISKAFHKVWHKMLLYKLKQSGISGKKF